MKKRIFFMGLCLLLSTGRLSFAQGATPPTDYPTKPIRLVIPFSAGGSTDALGRILAKTISESLSRPVVVENKAGASGTIAARYVARSAPDGYTILLGTSTNLVINPAVSKSVTYDTRRDFAPIVLAVELPSVVVVPPSLPIKSMQELATYVKRQPQGATYATAGIATPGHLGAELYRLNTGLQLTHIPYQGGAPALMGLMAGQTTMSFAVLPDAMPYIKSGQLRALATTTAKRTTALPDLPTVIESGIADFEVASSYGFLAPAGTPPAIIAILNKAFNAAINDKEVMEKLLNFGFEIKGGTAEAYSEVIAKETIKWKLVIDKANISAE